MAIEEDINLDDYSIEELELLQKRVAEEIRSRMKRDSKEKRAQLRTLAKELGYSLSRQDSPPSSGRRGRPRKIA
jgi:hypothetical protein